MSAVCIIGGIAGSALAAYYSVQLGQPMLALICMPCIMLAAHGGQL